MSKEKNKVVNDFVGTTDKKQEKEVKKAKKDKKPGFFKRLGGKFKDIFSELKKVSWPTFPKVVRQTGVVLVVVLAFLVVITAFDYGLYQLLTLLS
jgi:preprotein translocase subunit SecE